MNCKPNDLAVVMHRCISGDEHYDAYIKRLIGRVVTVTKFEKRDGEICWTIRHPFWKRFRGDRFLVTGIMDKHLQPICGTEALDAARRGEQAV